MYTLLLGIIKIMIPTLYTSISITDSKGNLILHLESQILKFKLCYFSSHFDAYLFLAKYSSIWVALESL